MPEKDCISIQQCFVTGSQTFALKCFRDLKWNNLPWSISDYRFGIVGRYNLLQGSDGQSLLNNKYTLGQIRWHILKQIISPDVKISFLFCSKNKKCKLCLWYFISRFPGARYCLIIPCQQYSPESTAYFRIPQLIDRPSLPCLCRTDTPCLPEHTVYIFYKNTISSPWIKFPALLWENSYAW